MRVERLHVDRPIPSRAHDLGQPFGVVLVGLVELHLQSGLHFPGVQTLDIEASAAQTVNKPGGHRTGLDPHFGIGTGIFRNASRNCSRIGDADAAPKPLALLVDNADRGRLLGYVQPHIIWHRNLRWCEPPGNMPGSRHYRLLGFAPRLPEVHTNTMVIIRFSNWKIGRVVSWFEILPLCRASWTERVPLLPPGFPPARI